MPENRIPGMTSRRTLISRGALLGGAAAAVSLPNLRAMAQDATSDSLLGRIIDRGKIVVGTGSTNPPWHFEDENGQLVGFDISMAMLLAGGIFGLDHEQILGGEEPRNYIEFVVHEADARIPDLLSDKVDINFQFMTVTPARALQVAFTVPYYREGVTLLLPADSEFNSLADMQGKGLTIAILANVTAEDMIHRGVPDATSSSSIRWPPPSRPSIPAASTRRVSICPPAAGWWPRIPRPTRRFRKAGTPSLMRHRSSREIRSSSISSTPR
jgi:ABC-type amino acid transport substrate-binding protein